MHLTLNSRAAIAFLFALCVLSAQVAADGFIIIDRPPRPMPGPAGPFPLEVVYHKVDVKVDGQTAFTKIDQSFLNPTNMRLEGHYIFPIPKGAVIKDFTMEINGKPMQAELLDATKARTIYEEIVRKMRDPALLEYGDRGVFSLRIFPIEPNSEKKISISYRQILPMDNGLVEYLYPLNTEKFSARPLKEVSINVNVEVKDRLKNIYSPTHTVDIDRRGDKEARVRYEEKNVKPDTDFRLYFSTDNSKVGLSVLSIQPKGEDGYFFLSVSPAFSYSESDIVEKDVTFVVDISGSMAGPKMDQAKKALLYCVENLRAGDKFEIVRFSTEAYALFKGMTAADKAGKLKAREFIEKITPVGGTNIEEALQMALKHTPSGGRPHIVVFMTDGKPTIGETDEDKLLQKLKGDFRSTRVFSFGIGEELNTHLLDKLAEQTKASSAYIGSKEDIEVKVSDFFDKAQYPVLTEVKIDYPSSLDVRQTYPTALPDLFKGANITVLGRYDGRGDHTITLSGLVNGKRQEFRYTAEFTDDENAYDFIAPLWGTRRVGWLLDQIRLNGDNKELVDEVTDLARKYGIVTPYTSYLILEDEQVRTARRDLPQDFQTLGNVVPPSTEASRQLKEEYSSIREKGGARGVEISKDMKALNSAVAAPQAKQADRLNYKKSDGRQANLTQQVRNVQGRAVYQADDVWIDSKLQQQKAKKNVRVQFASDEYFDLLNKKPQTAQFLALGRNVRFMEGDTYYEIHE